MSNTTSQTWDDVVLGGGIFGTALALELAGRRRRVLLLEAEPALLSRASHANQARVHSGYHYPRSFLTASRSRANFHAFVADYAEAVDRTVKSYYAVARHSSSCTAKTFAELCRRISAPCRPAGDRVRKLVDPALVEEIFEVEEFVFDATALREIVARRLERAGVDVRLGARARRVARPAGALAVEIESPHGTVETLSREVWVCTYAAMNAVLEGSGLPSIPLRHELAELALVRVPDELRDKGLTFVDGPFFSLLPFPSRDLHTLSHVRYTPHGSFTEPPPAHVPSPPPASRVSYMLRDAARFLPVAARCEYVESLWEYKTLLPRSDDNDSRPILFRQDHGVTGLHCVLGGKIDNIYELGPALRERFQGKAA